MVETESYRTDTKKYCSASNSSKKVMPQQLLLDSVCYQPGSP